MNWRQLQSEVAEWADRNFGNTPASYPMLGLVEECGEFMAAREQRSTENMEDALADQTIYVLNLCEKVGIAMGELQGPMADHADHELLGALAAASHAVLKFEQGIRKMDYVTRARHLTVALSIWYRWASWQSGGRLIEVTEKVWAMVKQRDWTKNRENAHEVVRDDLASGK